MDVALLVFLILLNGAFAMSEMALTASPQGAAAGDGRNAANTARRPRWTCTTNPTKFLSTVQIGITSIGVLNGIVGEAAFAAPLARWLVEVLPIQVRAAQLTATGLVVVIITFLTIIFGELVPKRVGQMYPEQVARLVAHADELAVHRHAAVRGAARRHRRNAVLRCSASATPARAASPKRRSPRSSKRAWTPA